MAAPIADLHQLDVGLLATSLRDSAVPDSVCAYLRGAALIQPAHVCIASAGLGGFLRPGYHQDNLLFVQKRGEVQS